MYTVLKRSQYFARNLGLLEVDIVFDQATYAKACLIKWSNQVEFKNTLFRLGPFHTIPVFISVIFKLYGDGGLTDIITEAGLVASGSLTGVVTGHHYNRAVHAIKVDYEAMARLEYEQLGEYIASSDNCEIDLDLLKDKVLDLRRNFYSEEYKAFIRSESVSQIHQLLVPFRRLDRGPMNAFSTQFLEMVEIFTSIYQIE